MSSHNEEEGVQAQDLVAVPQRNGDTQHDGSPREPAPAAEQKLQ
jgi:hypothetical protein